MPVVTIQDYESRPSHSRQCPNLRTCWPGLSQSFNPCVPDRPLMLRRSAFLSVLILRLLHSTLYTLPFLTSLFALPATALNILFFFFVAWNLHLIVEMQGERKVFGIRFGRRSFDAFLWGLVAVHIWMLGWDIFTGYLLGVGGNTLWTVMLLVIFGVAWVATWDPEVSFPWNC
ncbi:uncharacterized protein BDR25DRAFT_91502 [Lindgomyces ingoldianus]|uniref:Uncharacterized protein n=1 Tax=Lindgomyces ingoldianus TaxID=673940 RepID=A0ACB6QGG0_9PLEO|nr:uncharacterized protein BDR25DRAFT_91502 [Lindgomyces ingoldianus]KAF2465202.1 hypothetical protein BDR25DRAFT_91502 [Lindgomyces ingoldianus]